MFHFCCRTNAAKLVTVQTSDIGNSQRFWSPECSRWAVWSAILMPSPEQVASHVSVLYHWCFSENKAQSSARHNQLWGWTRTSAVYSMLNSSPAKVSTWKLPGFGDFVFLGVWETLSPAIKFRFYWHFYFNSQTCSNSKIVFCSSPFFSSCLPEYVAHNTLLLKNSELLWIFSRMAT